MLEVRSGRVQISVYTIPCSLNARFLLGSKGDVTIEHKLADEDCDGGADLGQARIVSEWTLRDRRRILSTEKCRVIAVELIRNLRPSQQQSRATRLRRRNRFRKLGNIDHAAPGLVSGEQPGR